MLRSKTLHNNRDSRHRMWEKIPSPRLRKRSPLSRTFLSSNSRSHSKSLKIRETSLAMLKMFLIRKWILMRNPNITAIHNSNNHLSSLLLHSSLLLRRINTLTYLAVMMKRLLSMKIMPGTNSRKVALLIMEEVSSKHPLILLTRLLTSLLLKRSRRHSIYLINLHRARITLIIILLLKPVPIYLVVYRTWTSRNLLLLSRSLPKQLIMGRLTAKIKSNLTMRSWRIYIKNKMSTTKTGITHKWNTQLELNIGSAEVLRRTILESYCVLYKMSSGPAMDGIE